MGNEIITYFDSENDPYTMKENIRDEKLKDDNIENRFYESRIVQSYMEDIEIYRYFKENRFSGEPYSVLSLWGSYSEIAIFCCEDAVEEYRCFKSFVELSEKYINLINPRGE